MNGTNTEPVPADKASSMGYLESYTYSCMEGYKTNDELCTVCQPDGELSSPAPDCVRKFLIIYSQQNQKFYNIYFTG